MNLHQQILFLTSKVKQQDGILTPTETKQLAELLLLSHTSHLSAEVQCVRLRDGLRDKEAELQATGWQ